MQKSEITELAAVYGFIDMGPQKNQYMYSYKSEAHRMNIYFTTGTVTLEPLGREAKIKVFKKVEIGMLEVIMKNSQ